MADNFGPREIRQLRRLLKLTQGELAARIAVSVETVRCWESQVGTARHRRPRPVAVQALLRLQDALCGR